MTNDEARMTKEDENPMTSARHSVFVIDSSLVIGRGSSCSGWDMRTAEF